MIRLADILGLFGNLLLFLVQVLILKNVVMYDYAFCFAYVMLILMIPLDTSPIVQLLVGFSIGIIIDVFYNTIGMHAAASVLMVFVKIYWMKVLTPSGGYDIGTRVNMQTQGLQWFIIYAFPLILVHSFSLFIIEASGFNLFGQTLLKGLYSSVFTMIMVLILQYLFYKKINS
ncbi:Rod shape-determining protein MreD [Reichenbachiella versicolor]|uniref:Rod shape-determining protein MreD n=1 Tax=Reichenbachiella versicolor TaxID=1821036 RepID=UPI000D6E0E86|nr:Rod shape-determining protein MreD [Reichenbachiella versicolor]